MAEDGPPNASVGGLPAEPPAEEPGGKAATAPEAGPATTRGEGRLPRVAASGDDGLLPPVAAEDSETWADAAPARGRSTVRRRPCCVRAMADFPWCSAHCPVTFAFVVLVGTFAAAGILFPGIEVDTDFDTFLVADGHANEVQAAFLAARPYTGVSAVTKERRLQERLVEPATIPDSSYDVYNLRLMYKSKGDSLFTLQTLRIMRDFELRLRGLAQWKAICDGTGAYRAACEPGFSVVNSVWLAWPQRDISLPQEQFALCNVTGVGQDPLDLRAARALIKSRGLQDLLFPAAYKEGTEPEYLAANFQFHMFRCLSPDCRTVGNQKAQENDRAYHKFLAEELFPTLTEFKESGNPAIDVFWHGNFITKLAVWNGLQSDSYMAMGSAAFIVFYLAVHASSLLLSLGAILLTIAGIPMAFVTMALMSGSKSLGGASFLSLFLIIGLGADVVLVFVSVWDQTLLEYDPKDHPQRVKCLYRNAGVACLMTSLTTACSFFANVTSVLRALREFGLFMGLCIVWTYAFILVGMPPLLIAREAIAKCCPCMAIMWRALGSISSSLPGSGSSRSWASLFVDYVLFPCRRSCCVFFVLLPLLLSIWTAKVVNVAGGKPTMFPERNNEYHQDEVNEKFTDMTIPSLGTQTYICNIGRETPPRDGPTDCGLNWCDVEQYSFAVQWYGAISADSGNSTCECKPNRFECADVPGATPTRVRVKSRVVGVEDVAAGFWSSAGWRDHVEQVVRNANGPEVKFVAPTKTEVNKARALNKVVQMHWESGMTHVAPYLLAPEAEAMIVDHPDRYCHVSEVCYCGAPACRLWQEPQNAPQVPRAEWSTATVFTAMSGGRRLGDEHIADSAAAAADLEMTVSPGKSALRGYPLAAHDRRLSEGTTDIYLVWGLKVQSGTPLFGEPRSDPWAFNPDFKPEAPSVQRHFLSACRNAAQQDLSIVRSLCWVDYFRTWLHDRKEVFPVPGVRFGSLLLEFTRQAFYDDYAAEHSMWFTPEGELRAAMVQFEVGMSQYTASLGQLVSNKDKWDAYVTDVNLNAPVGADDAWHTSKAWIRAEAESAIISSTAMSMVVSAVCGFAGALGSTHLDISLSTLALLAVVGVTLLLAWFITAVLGWAIGAIEVLGLIIFVGYSITYALHICHKYREHTRTTADNPDLIASQRRQQAVTHALETMTSAVVGSAVTTLGSSFFLFFCTINIFVKIAAILFAVTFLAAIYAILALPVALLCMGPFGLFGCGCLAPCVRGCARVVARKVQGCEKGDDQHKEGDLTSLESAEGSVQAIDSDPPADVRL